MGLCVSLTVVRFGERSSGSRLQGCHCNPSLSTLAFAMEKGFGFKASFEVRAAFSKTKGNKTKTSPRLGGVSAPHPAGRPGTRAGRPGAEAQAYSIR